MAGVVFYLHRVYPRRKRERDDILLSTFVRALKLIGEVYRFVPVEALLGGERGRLAAITFDDGYADNWVYAYPILKEMKVPAHLFLTSGRIGEGGVRKTLFDYWSGRVSMEELYSPRSMAVAHAEFVKHGSSSEFLTWEELDLMRDVFTFGAHGKHHLAYPSSSRVVDFYDGGNFHWTVYVHSEEPFVGLPLFSTRSALDCRRFFPFKEVLDFCRSFPKTSGWKERLRMELRSRFGELGYFESEEEARNRVRKELVECKAEIERKLGVRVETFSWPFGHYSELGTGEACSVYRYIFTIKKGILRSEFDRCEIPRVSLGKDIFTVLGRLLFFSTEKTFSVYKLFKRGKVL